MQKNTFLVLSPGPFTTVQDTGRFGYRQMGVPVSGALDGPACRIANLLVGNPEDSAVLEITIVGPTMGVIEEVDVALTGAEMEMKVNYKPVAPWRCVRLKPGDLLSFQTVKKGCRGYLAATGGIGVPKIMGSRSTYLGGRLGGVEGRAVKKGDILRTGPGEVLAEPVELPESLIPAYPEQIVLRAVPGPQDDFFDEGLKTFFSSEFTVSSKADRMGYRLEGPPVALKAGVPESIISEPSVPGGVQIPADKQPIVLLVEQTVGGYAKIATVVSTDIPRVAQATPGDTIRFEKIDIETAHALYMENERRIGEISDMLKKK